MEHPLVKRLLIPPPLPHDDDDQGHPPPDSILLDPHGYISPRENGSTAEGLTRSKHRIKVTLWPAPPPRVSCFTVHCPDLPFSELRDLPTILTTEDDLALFRVIISRQAAADPNDNANRHYFVYQAGGKSKRPSLHLVTTTPPGIEFSDQDAALLRLPARRKFFIAILRRHPYELEQLQLHLYSSKTGWSTKRVRPLLQDFYFSYSNKAITIGGQRGSVGWVDLWHGILICDLLVDSSRLHCIPLPPPVVPKPLKGHPSSVRDVIVDRGHIKFFDMHTYAMMAASSGYKCVPDGWEAVTWKLDLSKRDCPNWEDDCKIKISEVPLKGTAYAQMLPTPNLNEGEDAGASLVRLCVSYPALSLHDDGVVYVMNRLEHHGTMAWVVAVDMRNKALQGVAFFGDGTGRPIRYGFTFLQSGISKHLGIWSSTEVASV